MAYKHKSMDNRRKARRMLEKVLHELENVPPNEGMNLEATSSVGKASLYFLRMDNVAELHIYNEGPERWYADIVLKEVPDGYTRLMGSPSKMPLRDLDAAMDYARRFLLGIRDSENTAERPDSIVFNFDDVNFHFPEDVYKHISDLRKMVKEELADDYVADLMERARARVGGEITQARMNAASPDDAAFVWMAASAASLAGHPRWPPNVYDEKTDKAYPDLMYPENLTPSELRKAYPWRTYQ